MHVYKALHEITVALFVNEHHPGRNVLVVSVCQLFCMEC